MEEPQRTTWQPEETGRLDVEVRRRTGLSNERARRAIRTGKVLVDGKRPVDPGIRIGPKNTIHFDMAAPNTDRTQPFGVKRVYRDDHLIVVDKPPGLASTPAPEVEGPTVLLAAGRMCKGPARPKVVHRLDQDTSGLLVFARTVVAARALREALDTHAVRREYRCVVQGRPPQADGLITSMLVRDVGKGKRGSRAGTLRVRPLRSPDPGPMPGAGKLAITRYETVATRGDHTALTVRLHTGRTHQIRIHLSEIGCPVLGERLYGYVPGAPRLALHAAVLAFPHPVTGEALRFESPWPADLADVTPIGRDW